MTCRERLKMVFQKKTPDRLPIRIWGVDPLYPQREDWSILYELIEKYDLEIFRNWQPQKDEIPLPLYETTSSESLAEKEGLKEIKTVIKTPKGKLTQIYYKPLDNSPGYIKKHFIENIEDAEKWLSIPEQKNFNKVDSYRDLEEKTGDRALLMIGIDEAMYSVQRIMGSELFSYWLYDEKELLHRMITKSFKNIENSVKHYLSYDIGDAYGWVGPELCIPPLASVKDFREFVFDYDKKIIDLVHSAGKLVWVHCHGDMAPVLKDFIEMGVDCLNPIEPPPVGKITLKQAVEICKGKMALEGGIEDGEFDILKPHEMEKLVEETIRQVKGSPFILSPTSSPTTWPIFLPRHKENYKTFIETAVKLRD